MNTTIKKTTTVSKNYANALIEIVNKNEINTTNFISELDTVNNTIKESKDLNSVMANPTFSNDIKMEILSAIFAGKVSDEILNFLKTLVEKNRIKEFPSIYSEFQYKLNEINNTQPVNIVSAISLTEEQKQKIINTLTAKLKKTILPNWETDRSILAGIIVKIYDNVIDMSLKARINKLGKSLMLK